MLGLQVSQGGGKCLGCKSSDIVMKGKAQGETMEK
jgi:hypothetical protein